MAFTFKQLKGTDYLKDAYPKINELGSNSASLSQDVENIQRMFQNIQTFSITDSRGRTPEGSQINQDYVSSYVDVYGSLVYPPDNVNSTGWIYAKITASNEGMLVFLPDNSEKIFTKVKHNGSWSAWSSYSSDREINKFIPGDILKNGDFDYKWGIGSGTLEDEVANVNFGLSLFYATQNMRNSKFPEPVMGTIQKSVEGSGFKAIIKATGVSGKEYIINIRNGYSKPVSQTITTTELWKGSQDLATKSTVRLKDTVNNYDYIEYYVTFSLGGAYTFKVSPQVSTVYFRDLNLVNNDSSAGFDLFEGAVTVDSSGLSITPYMSKKVTGNAVQSDQTGNITLQAVTGIKQI